MFKELIPNGDTLVIAEVGQNHQGDLETAKSYIRIFAHEGADVIKFQTRNNKYLFSKDALEKKYDNPNSFGESYGEHREALELKNEWLDILREECRKHNVKFMSTPFDEPSLELLVEKKVDILKVASFDVGNTPFLERIASKKIPTVLSIGGGQTDQIASSVKVFEDYGTELSVLHCVSEYPCEFNRLGLDNIKKLKSSFPQHTIGLSDHFNGILSGPVAYLEGARVFEKHVTLNRAWKGSDHSFALEASGFRKFVRDINRVKSMFKEKSKDELGKEPVFQKLGKSLVSYCDIKKGEEITRAKLSGKIFKQTYIPVRQAESLIGRIACNDIKKDEPLQFTDFE